MVELLLAITTCVCGVRSAHSVLVYKTAEHEYASLQKAVVQTEVLGTSETAGIAEKTADDTEPEQPEGSEVATEAGSERADSVAALTENTNTQESPETAELLDFTDSAETEIPAATELAADPYPKLDIDFETLKSVNSDFAAYLYMPALDIRYPVCYSRDNNEYLHQTFEGTKNPSGCLFFDMDSARDLTSMNTVVYGHNMKNGTMFGKLDHMEKDASIARSDPYFYLYTPDGAVRKYRIFSYRILSNVDELVYGYPISSEADYRKLVDSALQESLDKSLAEGISFDNIPRIVTLSTCYGTAFTHNFAVHGELGTIY